MSEEIIGDNSNSTQIQIQNLQCILCNIICKSNEHSCIMRNMTTHNETQVIRIGHRVN